VSLFGAVSLFGDGLSLEFGAPSWVTDPALVGDVGRVSLPALSVGLSLDSLQAMSKALDTTIRETTLRRRFMRRAQQRVYRGPAREFPRNRARFAELTDDLRVMPGRTTGYTREGRCTKVHPRRSFVGIPTNGPR
jgi:hypothetical protein